MKKRLYRMACKMAAAVLLGALICFLTYCTAQSDAFTAFADGTTINGFDVSGMTAAEAEESIAEAVESYTLDITLTSAGASDDEESADSESEEETADSEAETDEETSEQDEEASEAGEEETDTDEEASEAGEEETGTDSEEDDSLTSVVYTVSGADISLSLPEDFSLDELLSTQKAAYKALEEGESLSESDLTLTYDNMISYDEDALSGFMEEFAGQFEMGDEAANAVISYDEESGEFVIVPETYGGELSGEGLSELACEAVESFADTLDISDLIDVPAITSENEDLVEALVTANLYLDVELTYTFTVNSGKETISKEDILSWLVYDEESATINIDNEELQAYVDDLADTYSIYNSTSQFKTTSGSYITVKVSSAGETVDSDSLYNSIYANLTNGISGTFEAPYDESTVDDNDGIVDFDGNYVEVNLTAQHMYVYQNGSMVLESDIVSGKVSAGYNTPTGVYTIKSKETNRYLTGATYRSWVYYWMPFNGGIGFHDATWRSSFGGTIYLYSGSHGCINLPYSVAKSLYGYVSVGTYVVVYGGETSASAQSQTVSVTSSYTKTDADSSFNLNASTNGDGDLTYSSSDTSVVTVDSSGNVTIVGAGSATITVTAAATTAYLKGSATTTITVSHDYYYSSASWSSDYSTCKITAKCAGCGETQTLDGTVTSEVTKEATATETGTKVYTAVASYAGKKFTVTVTVSIPKTQEETTTAFEQ